MLENAVVELLKSRGNEAPFKANEAALAAYESTIGKPPSPAARFVCRCVCVVVYMSVGERGGRMDSIRPDRWCSFSTKQHLSPKQLSRTPEVYMTNSQGVS